MIKNWCDKYIADTKPGVEMCANYAVLNMRPACKLGRKAGLHCHVSNEGKLMTVITGRALLETSNLKDIDRYQRVQRWAKNYSFCPYSSEVHCRILEEDKNCPSCWRSGSRNTPQDLEERPRSFIWNEPIGQQSEPKSEPKSEPEGTLKNLADFATQNNTLAKSAVQPPPGYEEAFIARSRMYKFLHGEVE
jgi:hypothetical protein